LKRATPKASEAGAPRAARKRRRRRVGAAIAIALAFVVGLAVTAGADSLLWGTVAGLGVGGLGWGISLFGPGAEVALAELDDDRGEGLGDGSGLGDG